MYSWTRLGAPDPAAIVPDGMVKVRIGASQSRASSVHPGCRPNRRDSGRNSTNAASVQPTSIGPASGALKASSSW